MARAIYTQEEIQKRLDSLPAEVSKLLYSDELDVTVQKVGQKQQLHIDQMGALEAEVRQVLLGFTDTKDFPLHLIETLEIDRVKADAIAQDINDLLFVKIRDQMKQVYEKSKEEGAASLPIQNTVTTSVSLDKLELNPPASPAVPSTPAPTPSPQPMPAADVMLSQTTVTVPKPVSPPTPIKVDPAKPASYKTDPYREPAE